MNALVKPVVQTMSSRQLAEVLVKRHDNVKRTIELLAEKGVISHPQSEDGMKSANGIIEKLYFLNERDSYVVTAQLSPEITAKLVDWWLATKHLQPTEISTSKKTEPLRLGSTTRQCLMMAKACGLKGNQAILSVDRAVRTLTGESPLELLGVTHLISESKEKVFTPTQIGSMFSPKRSAQKVNGLIEAMGLQKRIDDIWVVTPEGEKFCEVLDTGKQHSNGTPVKQIKWYQSLVDQLIGEDGVE